MIENNKLCGLVTCNEVILFFYCDLVCIIHCTTKGINRSYSHFPTAKVCVAQDTIENGAVVCSNENNLQSVCAFECDEFFRLKGDPELKCGSPAPGTYEWDLQTPICERQYNYLVYISSFIKHAFRAAVVFFSFEFYD